MEYQKLKQLLDNTLNKPFAYRTSSWVEINDESRGTCNKSNQNKFKTSILRSNFSDYSYAYIFVSGSIAITGVGDDGNTKQADERKKEWHWKTVRHLLAA